MPAYIDVEKKAKDPAVFRQIVQELTDLPFADWTPWEEWIWLPAMLRYRKEYVHSKTEREKLAELCWFAEPVYGHDGMSVERMVASCMRYVADLGEAGDFIIDLHERGATFVRRRELSKLTRLCVLAGVDLKAA